MGAEGDMDIDAEGGVERRGCNDHGEDMPDRDGFLRTKGLQRICCSGNDTGFRVRPTLLEEKGRTEALSPRPSIHLVS
jgi:hypothetical protein